MNPGRGRRRRDVGVVLLALLLTLPSITVADDELPALECVKLLREARILRLRGDATAAIDLLREADSLYPGEMVVSVAMLEHYRESGNSPDELARLRNELTQRLADPEVPIARGTIDYLVRSHDLNPQAMAALLDALRTRSGNDASNLDGFNTILDLQLHLGRTDEARIWLARRLELDPAPQWHLRCLGLDFEQDQWEHAATHLAALLQHDPNSPGLRMSQIEVLGRLGEYDALLDALGAFETKLDVYRMSMRGTLGSLILDLAWVQHDAGAEERAETLFRHVLRLDPENAVARNAILHLYSSAEERAAHQSQLDQQWNSEDDPYALLDEGAAALASGDAQRASALLQRAVTALPGNEIAQYNLGLCAIRLEQWDAAEKALAAAIAVNPGRAESHLSRGIALQRLDRCPEAIDELTTTVALQPDLTQAHYYLYECHNKLGDSETARLHLNKYNASVEK